MTLISYAQNFEDVLLWRALGHIKNGFYIDVGANDPELHSVTKAFYDAGWHGINIEPMPSYLEQFKTQRPRDINLGAAAGAAESSITLFEVPSVNGWATTDAKVAEGHRANGYEVTEVTVPLHTLSGICAAHVRGDIHFLKIDVEGFEGEVLRGMDFARWRPWIVVVEATLPGSRTTNHEQWEKLVTDHRYQFAWFDGLNRYYVAEEHRELLDVLNIQPNVFDEFITHHLDKAWKATERAKVTSGEFEARAAHAEEQRAGAERRLEQANENARAATALSHSLADKLEDAHRRLADDQAKLGQARADIAGLQAQVANLEVAEAWAKDLEQRLLATHRSVSWRITRPVRAMGKLVRAMRAGTLLRSVVTRMTSNERMRRLLIPLMLRFPSLGKRVSQTIQDIKQDIPPPPAHMEDMPEEIKALPASARKVLADLKRGRTA
jgi:FkbM family methyltransferase